MLKKSIFCKFFIILYGGLFSENFLLAMKPIVERKKISRTIVKNTHAKTQNKKKNVKKKIIKYSLKTKNHSVPVINTTQLYKLETQIINVRTERQRWELQKKGLLSEFAHKQTAFAAVLPLPHEARHQQSILLALSSKSMDDFVHGTVMLNYLNAYRMRRNQAYINLVQNIHRANFSIQSCWKTEQNLLEQWRLEKNRVDTLLQKEK